METLKVQAVNQCVSKEVTEAIRDELIVGGLSTGTLTIERSGDSDFLSGVWQENGIIPVAMKICDPKNDVELTRKAAREFLLLWRESTGARPPRPRKRR